ncbi:MAG: sulfotransferase [Thermomicrobiales bacterium]|nr:sulfotransferase [Thermomicrobiales bacterium]
MADTSVMDGTMASPAVTALTVQMLNARRGALLDAAIETPRSGDTSEGWGLRVRGHLLARGGPVTSIEVVVPGAIVAATEASLPTPEVGARHPGVPGAADCGFTLLIDTLRLPLQFEVRLRATLADGSRVKFAAIRGARRPLQSAYAPRLQPLLVTSLGRMGTTLLMRMLAAHPGVVAYARPPYEARGGKYWLHLLRTLAAPADARKQLGAPMEFHLEPLAAGGNPFYSSAFAAWPEVERWSGAEYVADLAAFCQRSIDGWYLATARAQGQDLEPLAFFAEKHFPDDYPRLMRELYPASRELFLVRDFRDMVASMRAYNARKGFGDFGRERAASDEAWLADLRRGIEALRDAWRERGTPASLVRYEALVHEPEAALPPLLDALGLDASPAIVARMIGAVAPGAPELRGHGTTASPEASIGRWRRDLPDELRDLMQQQFAEVLGEFGYAME